MATQATRKIAHDSGDGATIFHCPFCGSGQVIARSDRSTECEYCHTCFTVQVQPQFPAFPQTIDGMPMQVPGMPGQIGGPPGVPPDPMAGGMPGQDPMGGMDDGEDDGNPFGDDEDGGAPGEEDDEDSGAPPFAKGAARRGNIPPPDRVYWHGTPSGDLRGGHYGLHVGTHEAAKQALEARIGRPAEGTWDGTREYGKTLLAGYGNAEPRYPAPGRAMYSDRTPVAMDAKPNVMPVRIIGEMTNDESTPHDDSRANGLMRAQLKRGSAKRGYFYTNDGEDYGSVSAVVPSGTHLERLPQHEIEPGATHYRPNGKTSMLRTASGSLLNWDNYLRHLAIRHADPDQKDVVLDRIREGRR